MAPKKSSKNKKSKLVNIESIFSKKLPLNKIDINPSVMIEDTKNKISNFSDNAKKEREKEKKR